MVHTYNPSTREASWCIRIIPAPGRLRQEEWSFEASLGYLVISCFQKYRRRRMKKGGVSVHCRDC